MTVKEFLQQAYRLKEKKRYKLGQIEAMKSVAEHSTSAPNAVRVSGTDRKSKIETAMDRILELEAEVEQITEELNGKYIEIATVIGRVEDQQCCLLLTNRYLAFRGWDEIAAEMGYSFAHVHRIHAKALILAKDEIPCDCMR